MTRPPTARGRPHQGLAILGAALLAWAALLGGCGPGAAGSGTGETFTGTTAVFGATTAPVCTSAFATSLACFKADGTPATTLAEGSLVAEFVDTPEASTVTVTFAANGVELDVRCKQLHFKGQWGITTTNDARFFGLLTTGQGQIEQPASLQVDTVGEAGTPVLSLTLRTADGLVVYGPVRVQRVGKAQQMAC